MILIFQRRSQTSSIIELNQEARGEEVGAYVLFMIIIGTQDHLMYSGDISSTEIVTKPTSLRLVVIAAGFMYQWRRRKP